MKKYLVLAIVVLLTAGLTFAENAVKNTDSKDLEGVQLRTIQSDFNHSVGSQPGMTTVNFITEDFENAGSIPSGWTDNPGTYPWQYDAGADHGPGSAHGGSYAAYFDVWTYTSGSIDSLISPSADLSTGTGFNTLSYWGWHNSGTDSVVVYLSESGTLTRLGVMPNSSSWTQYSYSFYSSDTAVKIYFIGYSDYGSYNLYIDDVSLDDAPLPTGDVAVNSLDAPAEVLLLAGTYTLTATVENLVSDPATLDSLVFSVVDDNGSGVEVFHNVRTGDIIAGNSTSQLSSTVDWTVAVADWYAVTVSAFMTGDANPGDNALTTTRIIQPLLSYPFEEDFEGGLVTSIWDWVGFGTGFGYTTIAGNVHSPDTALWFSYSGYPNERIVVSPPIAVSGSIDPLFRFWEKSSGSSGPAGDETHTIGFVAGSWDLANLDTIFFDDSSSTMINVYRETMVDPGTIEGDTLRIVLWYHNSDISAWNWYVDDISLDETPTGDVGPTDFVSGTSAVKDQAYSPVVEVTNYGGDTPDVPVKLVIDSLGVLVYTEWDTITAIPAFGAANASFADYTPLEGGTGVYTMTATTELVTVLLDNDPSNDTLTAGLTVYDAFLDFEADNGGLSPNNEWEWGTPLGSSPPGAYSGVNCWGTVLSGIYPAVATVSDLDFYLDVTGAGATLDLMEWRDMSSSSGYVRVFADSGNGYELLDQRQGYVRSWEPYSIDLTGYSGIVAMRLQFQHSTYVGSYTGWYVDDFAMTGCDLWFPADDIAAISIDEPTGMMFTGASVDPKGTVKNLGTDTQTFDAIMTIEDTATVIAAIIYADTVSVVDLASGASQQVTFGGWTVPAGDGETYTFTLTVENPGDFNTANNLVTADFDAYTHYSEGGPDAYGYMYYDNLSLDPLAPTYSWIELSTSPTADTAGTSSGNLGEFPIGFNFTFYSASFDSVYINGYGYVSFGAMYSSGLNDCPMPNSSTPNEPFIAGFWDYGYPYGTYDGATIYETFGTEPNRYMVIQYHNHKYSSYYDDMDFEIILHENGDVVMQYKKVGDPASSGNYGYGKYETVGIEEYTNYNSGLSYICNDDLVGNRLFDGLAILWHYEAPSIDAVMYSIDEPLDGAIVFNGTTVTPQITFGNESENPGDIALEFLIIDTATDDTVYSDYDTSLAVPAGDTVQVSFNTWNADPDAEYDAVATLALAGDGNPANDSKTNTFDVATHYSTGGPDEFGYRFIDNQGSGDEYPPEFAWYDLTISPTADTAGTSSGNLGKFPIGFDFDFYGTTFDSLYINGYGYLMFGDTYLSTSINDCPLPSATSPYQHMIGGFWDAGYPYGTYDGATIYETAGIMPYRYMVVQYHNHRYSTYYNDMDFEIIIYENGDIVFQYLNVAEDATNYGVGQWATVGIQSDTSGERYGISYLCNDDPLGNRLVDSLAIKWYYQPYAHDVVADEFIQPANSSGLVNVPIDPEVLFTNNGTSDETNVPVRLLIDPGAYNDAQLIAVLDSGTSYAQTFTQFTPLTSGTYTLTAISELVGDEDPASDTLIMTYTAYDVILDFETSKNGLAGGGDWEWGVPNNPEGPANAYSGVNLWATNLSGDYTTGLHTLEFELILGSSSPAIGIASWYDTELSYDGGNFAVSTDSGTTWNVITPDIGYSGTANSSHPLTGDPIFTGHDQGFWETANFDLSAYAGDTVFVRFAFGADGSVYYPGWHIDDMALADAILLAPDMDVTPLTITGEADPGFADYDTITVSNSGDATLIFTAAAYMDETFTNALGQREQFYALDEQLNIRRGRSAFTPIDNSSIAERQQLEGTKTPNADKANEGIYVPTSYIAPQNPLPIIAVDIAYENFDDGLLPSGWSIVDGGSTIDTWMPQSTNTCTRTGTYLFNDWFTVDSDCAVGTDTLDEQLLTGYYDLSSYSQVNLAFGSNFQKYATYGDSGYVEVRNGSTGAWSLINLFDADLQSYEDFDITSLIPTRDSVQIRFRYTDRGDDCWYWMIDDFLLYEPDTPWLMIDTFGGSIPPLGAAIDIEVALDAEDIGPGIYTGRVEIISNDIDVDVPVTFVVGGLGTVAGQVTDANTTGPIEGAIVTATWVSATTVVDTTDVSGNYSIDITPGTVNVTVEAVGYVTDSQNVVVVEDQTTTHNVALGAPLATIDITPVVDNVGLGDTSMYNRYLYNTGTAPLNYYLSITDPAGDLLLNMGINAISDRMFNFGTTVEFDPNYDYNSPPIISAFSDLLFDFDAETGASDTRCLGVEFDGTYFWVTGAGDGTGTQNKIHKFDRDGIYIESFMQNTSSAWGWRDLAWDGQYLYASDDYVIDQFDPLTGTVTGVTITGPHNPSRAIAYDPVNDLFYVANWGSTIYGVNRAGVLVDTIANTLSTYGMAYDGVTEGGPFLWTFSGGANLLVSQVDLATGLFTGVSFTATPPPPYSGQIIGGMCYTTEWNTQYGAIVVLGQGSPDYVAGYEITESWLYAISGGSGSVAPGDSALIEFMVDFRGPDIVVDSTYEADANINNNSLAPTPVIPFSITAIAGSLAGTVTDSNTTSPIEGAVVTASSDDEAIIVDTTDASGNYSIDIAPGPMTVTVEADGYVTDINQVIVFQNQTTTHDVALTAPIATIDTSPVVDTVIAGDTALYPMFLYNVGTAPLDYEVVLEDTSGGPVVLNLNAKSVTERVAGTVDLKINGETESFTSDKGQIPVILDVSWLSATSGGTGTIAAGDSAEIELMVDFRDPSIVVDSTYEANAHINNNDPYSTPVIRFSITAEAAGCPHVVGDVNGSDSYNGLDITYGVAFFKGGSDPLCPDCPIGDCNAWHYCGDVNGSCSYNGLDITYGVAYFKGGAGPIFCPDCPPIVGPTVTIQDKELKPAEQPAVESKSKSKKESSLKR